MRTFENNVLSFSDEITDFFICILLHLVAKHSDRTTQIPK